MPSGVWAGWATMSAGSHTIRLLVCHRAGQGSTMSGSVRSDGTRQEWRVMWMKVDGYACDQCNQFSRDRGGWIRVTPIADVISQTSDGTVEVCGPACLLKVARELVKAESQVEPEELEHMAKQAVLDKRDRDRQYNQEYEQSRNGGPVKCDVPGCGRSFKNLQGLSMHKVRIHDGNKWNNKSGERNEASTQVQ